MSRYHYLLDSHFQNHEQLASKIQTILDAIDRGDLESAKAEVTGIYENVSKMRLAFEEMSLLVKVLMLEFRAADDTWRTGPTPRQRGKTPANAQPEIQLELFALLAEIQAKNRVGA